MKSLKLFLDTEDEEDLNLGLIRLTREIPDYELFYHINGINGVGFKRIKELRKTGVYYDYYHQRFEAYFAHNKSCIQFIANKSSQHIQKKVSNELFSGEQETKFLLNHFQDVDYLLKTSEPFNDFSLILLPENLMFPIQHFPLSPIEELYQIIQYYE